MIYTIYTDLHIGSPYLEKDILPTTKEQILAENSYDVGDTFEIKNCDPKDLNNLLIRQANFQQLFHGRYVTGNHSVDKGKGIKQIIIGDILFIHGDYIFMGQEKAEKFRNEQGGQGSGIIQKIGSKFHGKVSKKEAKQLAEYAKSFGVSTIVTGHVHVKSVFDKVIDGIRVINCPRGRTEINI